MVKSRSKSLSVNDAQELGTAVTHWLEYQILCGRGMLLSESYLAHPIGEFLRTRHNGAIEAEWTYAELSKRGKAKRGRPKQIDYALFGTNSNNPLTAIEAKWVTDLSRRDKQRYVDDILRLECVRNPNGGMTRYFVLAGLSADVQRWMSDDIYTFRQSRDNFLTHFLPVDNQRRTVKVFDCASYVRRYFKTFYETYRLKLPKSYRASHVFDSNTGTVGKVRVLIWGIQSVQKRSTFVPYKKTWADVEPIETDDDELEME